MLKASFCTENLSWNWLTAYPAKSRQIVKERIEEEAELDEREFDGF